MFLSIAKLYKLTGKITYIRMYIATGEPVYTTKNILKNYNLNKIKRNVQFMEHNAFTFGSKVRLYER